MARTILPGKSYPLGANWDGHGVNFALYSEQATRVDLCLFSGPHPDDPSETIPLREVMGHVWHAYVPNIQPGQLYGFRAHGPYEPHSGLRFNSAKLLIDPYAKALAGNIDWEAPVFGYKLGHPDGDVSQDAQDDAWGMPKAVVIDPRFDWEGDTQLRLPWNTSIIYETHVKGLTALHPDVPEHLRGTYAGLASPPVLDYLKNLGVTAVELLPVHAFVDDKHLLEHGLRNYWGYNSINFFAPEARYSSSGDMGGQVREFKEMVKALHRAGMEVILDVVYNHTAEGSELGPTLSFRGIDNTTYYRLVPDNARYYMDYTGTGNTPNSRHPQVIKLIMDSLRYWVLDMHVDGFRFDLAAALARGLYEVDHLSAFFDTIHQDPVISTVKLIAEPWDVGDGGYQVGNFPVLWTEWNGKYRDCVRRYWKGDESQVSEMASRLTGSSDLYQDDGRRPTASINFVACHDGFTLRDLVSYNDKHNEANGEDNRDGANDNNSWNCGAEGPTENPEVRALRQQQIRNLMGTVLLSEGVPMILGGDEFGRSQGGNNNAYCQDNAINWYNWNFDDEAKRLIEFTRKMIELRKAHPSLHRRKYFQGRRIRGSEVKDLTWLRADGGEMTDEEWDNSWVRTFGMRLGGDALGEVDDQGNPVVDDTLLILLNAHSDDVPFVLPEGAPSGGRWERLVDTSERPAVLAKVAETAAARPASRRLLKPAARHAAHLSAESPYLTPGDEYLLTARSLAVLRYVPIVSGPPR